MTCTRINKNDFDIDCKQAVQNKLTIKTEHVSGKQKKEVWTGN